MIEDIIKDKLRFSPVVRTLTSDRIYTDDVNLNHDKYVLISVIDDEDEFDSSNNLGQSNARLQIDCYAKSKTIARLIAKQVNKTLQQKSFTTRDLIVQICIKENRVPSYEKIDSTIMYRESLDYTIKYNEVKS